MDVKARKLYEFSPKELLDFINGCHENAPGCTRCTAGCAAIHDWLIEHEVTGDEGHRYP